MPSSDGSAVPTRRRPRLCFRIRPSVCFLPRLRPRPRLFCRFYFRLRPRLRLYFRLRPRRRFHPRRRPPETPLYDGAPGDPDPPAGRSHSPRSFEFPAGPSSETEEYTCEESCDDLVMVCSVRTETGDESGDDYAGHPGPQRVGTRIRVRQSVLYSDRPRRSRPRMPAPAEEHPSMVSSSELGRTVIDIPRSEELSLSDPPLLTPQTADEMRDETDDDELYNETGEDKIPPEHTGFGFGTLGQQALRDKAYPPRPKWLGGIQGQAMLEEHGDYASSGELSPMATNSSRSEALPGTQFTEKSTADPDDDTEEVLRSLEEYFAANPPVSISQALHEIIFADLPKVLTAQAAKLGTETLPPQSSPRRHFLVDQARQDASAAASHPQHSTIHRKPRGEASTEEIIENAKKWMHDELVVVFEEYVGRRDDLKGVDYELEKLCHQCVNVENYNKIFHHYNFTVKFKKSNSDDSAVALYFAEVKQMFGRKSYFCCELESNEDGLCYACKNQGMDDLKHPATGGFDTGLPDIGFNFWYTDE